MTALKEAIKKVATGPHLSKNLTESESYQAMQEALTDDADPVQIAIFLIALRMKTETPDENLGILSALQSRTRQRLVDIDELVIVSEPFNGFNRYCPVAAFLPAVLAACGLPAVSQGVREAGPKFGVTHSQVLSEAGVRVDLSVEEAEARIKAPEQGWAFIDQSQSTPALYGLHDLRQRMVKRTCLATLEKLLMPLKANSTHLVTGFVHKAYPSLLSWLAYKNGFHSSLIIRGVEGGVIPTLRDMAECFRAHDGDARGYQLDPKRCDIQHTTRGVVPVKGDQVSAQETVELAMKALDGISGAAFDCLLYGAALILWHCGKFDSLESAAVQVKKQLKNGRAKAFFQQGIQK